MESCDATVAMCDDVGSTATDWSLVAVQVLLGLLLLALIARLLLGATRRRRRPPVRRVWVSADGRVVRVDHLGGP